MDELSTYEEDHSDALRPVQREADQSHAGVAKLVSPLSREEAQLLFEAQELTHREALQKVCFSLTTQIATATAHHHCQCNSQPIANISAVNSSLVPQPSVYTPTPSHVLGLSVPLPLPYPTAPLASTNYPSFSDLNPLKNRRGELIPVPGFGLPNSSQPVENPNRSVSRPAPVAPSRIVPYIPNGECVHGGRSSRTGKHQIQAARCMFRSKIGTSPGTVGIARSANGLVYSTTTASELPKSI